jgi:predicted house-cleaning noncanonical NTP pyrophosphatase (MazG superfamily)
MSRKSNKLVRDKIPAIILANGEKPVVRTLDKDEYLQELLKKLAEEHQEFTAELELEELADIQEVILALADVLASRATLEEIRLHKVSTNGAFNDKLYLESIE